MYRCYDTFDKKWIKDNIYLSPYGELYIFKKKFFGRSKLNILSNERYIVHKYIGLVDKDDVSVYEGDIVEAQVDKDKIVQGVVAFATELSAYIILCSNVDEFYTLGTEICQYIKVIGNVFDNEDENKEQGSQY